MQLRSERNPSAMIREAMAKSHGSVANAARLLGMRRTTLVEKMRKSEVVG
jgi:DNA-binding NtrC family response regulator